MIHIPNDMNPLEEVALYDKEIKEIARGFHSICPLVSGTASSDESSNNTVNPTHPE